MANTHLIWCSKCEFLTTAESELLARVKAEDHRRKVHAYDSGFGIEPVSEIERKYNFLQSLKGDNNG